MFKLVIAILGLYTAHKLIDDVTSNKGAKWNECLTFRPLPDSDCKWMSEYCSLMVGPNHYFTDDACKYYFGEWRGEPLETMNYTCCAVRRDL